MALMTWDPKFSVNIREIDNQHKKLFELINNLHDSMKTGKGKEALGKILSELADYTVNHFSAEEKLFQTYGYPEQAQHKKMHTDLTKQVMDLKGKLDKGDVIITIEVMNFLKDWLNNHILVSDKKYSAFLNGKGVV